MSRPGSEIDKNLFPHGVWLLCPPTFFDVTYEINPWMNVDRSPVSYLSAEQWRTLHHTMIRLGAFVVYIEPAKGVPDLVFTANAGLVKGEHVVVSRFRHPERQAEEPCFEEWFRSRGYTVHTLSRGFFEGEGDALFAGEVLFGGYGFRSEPQVYEDVARALELDGVVLCELVDDRFYHLDICFCPLNAQQALCYPKALSKDSVRRMEQHIELIPVPKDDAENFVCNSVVLGANIVLPARCKKTAKKLTALGMEAHGVELGEFLKGGGSAKCLSLRVDR